MLWKTLEIQAYVFFKKSKKKKYKNVLTGTSYLASFLSISTDVEHYIFHYVD